MNWPFHIKNKRYNAKHMEYTFSSLQQEIVNRLNELDHTGFFGNNRNLTIIDGFVYLPIQDRVGPNTVVGGRSLPTVVVVDNVTGQIWNFSLKHLVPRVELT